MYGHRRLCTGDNNCGPISYKKKKKEITGVSAEYAWLCRCGRRLLLCTIPLVERKDTRGIAGAGTVCMKEKLINHLQQTSFFFFFCPADHDRDHSGDRSTQVMQSGGYTVQHIGSIVCWNLRTVIFPKFLWNTGQGTSLDITRVTLCRPSLRRIGPFS